MQERMSALLEESLHREQVVREDLAGPEWVPAADAFETDREVLLFVDVPGVRRDDMRLEVEGGRLVVRGERRLPEGLDPGLMHRGELLYGTFFRSFELTAAVEETGITASHRSGVLAIRLPKRATDTDQSFEIPVD
jgi:HSP20 family protein